VQLDVEQVPVYLVLPLRQKVLRPNHDVGVVGFEGDSAGTHFAAFDESSAIVGVVSLIGDLSDSGNRARWRLRGMASDPDRQGQGIGRELILGLLDFVARAGGGEVWCNARLQAVGFYQRFGFAVIGEVFEEPGIGPHVRMTRTVDPIEGDVLEGSSI
jgi:predicted GNAT family N-acyltransferase